MKQNPRAFFLEHPLDIDEARTACRKAAERIEVAHEEYERAIERKAEAEATYRQGLAQAFVKHRAEGKGAGEAELLAKADVAEFSHERDIAAGMERACLERLEDLRGERASLHRLTEWSRQLDPFVGDLKAAA